MCIRDRFYTVRVAGLRALVRANNTTPSEDGRSPGEQLSLINSDARKLMQRQQITFKKLRRELEAVSYTHLDVYKRQIL